VLLAAIAAGGWVYWATTPSPPPPLDQAPGATAGDAVQQALHQGKPTVVEFGSTSCVSCRDMKPLLAELARVHGSRVAVADVDILKERDYISRYRIQVMPTQVFFDAQGRETSRHVGKIGMSEMLVRLGLTGPADQATP
jgi:thioredoxin 1